MNTVLALSFTKNSILTSSKSSPFCHRCPVYLSIFSLDISLRTVGSISAPDYILPGTTYCSSCWVLRPKSSGLDPTPFFLYVALSCLLPVGAALRASLESFPLGLDTALLLGTAVYRTPGLEDAPTSVDCGLWLRWLVRK